MQNSSGEIRPPSSPPGDEKFKFPDSIPTKTSKVVKIGNFRLGKTIGVGSFGKVKSM